MGRRGSCEKVLLGGEGMNKDNFTFDNYREGMNCPVCGHWVSLKEYIYNEGVCDDCWEKEHSEFEIYDWDGEE